MASAKDNFRVFRVRIKGDGKNRTKQAWNMNQVGIWYGAWSPQQYEETIRIYKEKGRKDARKDAMEYLAAREKENGCNWTSKSGRYPHKNRFTQCKKFANIKEHKDWVVVNVGQKLCLGQLDGGIQTKADHELNIDNGVDKEVFHFRRVINQKCFPLSELPDVYWNIPGSGRHTVHEHPAYNKQLKLLVNCKNSREVNQHFKEFTTDEWLESLGSTEWESFCFGYLIIEHAYVPTGLRIRPGSTLKTHDAVGKTRKGAPIFAQCKKSPGKHSITDGFKAACSQGTKNLKAFWFAYGGANADPNHPNIQIIDKTHMKEWLETEKGKNYLNVFRGQKP